MKITDNAPKQKRPNQTTPHENASETQTNKQLSEMTLGDLTKLLTGKNIAIATIIAMIGYKMLHRKPKRQVIQTVAQAPTLSNGFTTYQPIVYQKRSGCLSGCLMVFFWPISLLWYFGKICWIITCKFVKWSLILFAICIFLPIYINEIINQE